MKPSEVTLLGALMVFAGVTLAGSPAMPFRSGVTFGPGFLPLIMSVAVFAIGAGIALRDLKRARTDNGGEAAGIEPAEDVVAGDGPAEDGPAKDVRTVLFAVALIAATLLGAAFGSLLLPLGLCLLLTTSLVLGRGWVVGSVSTLVTLAAIHAIFALWLQIPLR